VLSPSGGDSLSKIINTNTLSVVIYNSAKPSGRSYSMQDQRDYKRDGRINVKERQRSERQVRMDKQRWPKNVANES